MAPSPCKEAGREGTGFSTTTFGVAGIACGGGVGVTTGIGVGATKTGSGNDATFTGGAEGIGEAAGGMTCPCAGDGELNVGWAEGMSLKIDVKLGSEMFADDGAAGAAGPAWPNNAVKSPTDFFGGSTGWEENAGISVDLSPRNGP